VIIQVQLAGAPDGLKVLHLLLPHLHGSQQQQQQQLEDEDRKDRHRVSKSFTSFSHTCMVHSSSSSSSRMSKQAWFLIYVVKQRRICQTVSLTPMNCSMHREIETPHLPGVPGDSNTSLQATDGYR
jgi:hypothetical protein